jgi:hypothetical protein
MKDTRAKALEQTPSMQLAAEPKSIEYAKGHPINDKQAMADWMKYDSVEAMDEDHDDLHLTLTRAYHKPSFSLAVANGSKLTWEQERLASCEEAAVLAVQRWLQWCRKGGW